MNWNFRTGGKTENPKDAGIKEFSKHIFESVVREATQNPIDKRLDKTKPVIVKFEFGEIDKNLIPGYSELVARWHACYEKWKDQSQYEIFLKAIIDRIASFGSKVPYLTISDYNTEGMDFTSNSDIDKTGYGAFSRGNHSYHHSDNAAGSEGQGKSALYAISAMRTMFVHTISNKGSIYEGLTRYATHELQGTRYNSDGYYPHQPDEPKYEKLVDKTLPFRRTDISLGTSITLIGLWEYEDVEEKMIKSAINNFWMAIMEGELVIKVNQATIDKDNIERLIEQYLPERSESSRTKSNPTKYGRARSYFETWANKLPDVTEIYSDRLTELGNCKLKISQHADYPGKIAFFREQKMLILKSSINTYVSKGYCGVFLCDDEEGNKILRKMEGKTHTEWDPSYCMTEQDRTKGYEAMKALNIFINESWQKYRSKHFPESIDLKGLGGINFNSRSGRQSKKVDNKEKKPTIPSEKTKNQPDFEKTGIRIKQLRSKKENNTWYYTLSLTSNESKIVRITMLPATEANRVSESDLLSITETSKDWFSQNNFMQGSLIEGENTITFSLNETERVALDFKFQIL